MIQRQLKTFVSRRQLRQATPQFGVEPTAYFGANGVVSLVAFPKLLAQEFKPVSKRRRRIQFNCSSMRCLSAFQGRDLRTADFAAMPGMNRAFSLFSCQSNACGVRTIGAEHLRDDSPRVLAGNSPPLESRLAAPETN